MITKYDLLNGNITILNLGLESFALDMKKHAHVTHLQWKPPAFGNGDLAHILAQIQDDNTEGSLGYKIHNANQLALNEIVNSQPVLIDIQPAINALQDMDTNTYLHAGPPIEWENMAGSMRGGMIGALIYENRAKNAEEALELISSGIIKFAPCHSRNAAGPMAGIISPSMPVMVIENKANGKKAFVTLNEGWGRTLRFGAFDEAVIKRLRWMQKTLSKVLKAVIDEMGGIDIKALIAQAIQMGDECHNRDIAATNLFFKLVCPKIVANDELSYPEKSEVISFLGQHEHFFLNLAMAACKVSLISAENIPYCTIVTVMARNGYEVGIRVSGLGNQWFVAKASVANGLFFPGYSRDDASPDIGDSAITETGGIGAFAMAAAPAIVQFVGGTTDDAFWYTNEMYKITTGRNYNYKIPNIGFAGTPTGIDIRKVIDYNILPVINTGIAHKEPGHGLVGAGVVNAPQGCFESAMHAFWQKYK